MMNGRISYLFLVFALTIAAVQCGPAEKNDGPQSDASPAVHGSAQSESEAPVFRAEDDFDDMNTVNVPIPDFDKMPLSEKTAVYLLSRAAETDETVRAARAGVPETRTFSLLSGILRAKSRVPRQIFEKIESYALRFKLNGGPVDAWTGEGLKPRFIPGELAAAAEAALAGGIDFGLDGFAVSDLGANRLEQLDQYLASLRPVLYGTAPSQPEVAVGEVGTDAASAVPPVSRTAADAVRALLPSLTAEERVPLDDLAAFFETGEWERYTAYLRASEKAVHPRELIAAFDGPIRLSENGSTGRFTMIAALLDPDRTPLVEKVAKKVDYFERNLPGNAMFKRPLKKLTPPSAAAYFVIQAPPWAEVLDASAYTLPMFRIPTDGRRHKAMLFLHTASTMSGRFAEAIAAAFSSDDAAKFLRLKWREAASSAFSILKNVIGYQAGTRKYLAESPDPKNTVSPLVGVLEEIHSDLVALYFSFDPEAHALGVIPEEECARAVLLEYVSLFLEQADASDDIETLRGRRTIAVRAITRGLLRSGALTVDSIDGHFQVVLKDVEAARKSIESQLTEAGRILALGELGAAQSLLDTDGGPLPKTWGQDAAARLRTIGVRQKNAFLFPEWTAKTDKDGNIVDITADLSASLLKRLSKN